MTAAEIFFTELTQQIPNAKTGKMFGALCMKMPNGKSASMLWKDNIVVKLHGGVFEEAMGLSGSKLFEPMEGKPMKEWVQISFDHKDKWKTFVEKSAKAVSTIEKKLPKKKK